MPRNDIVKSLVNNDELIFIERIASDIKYLIRSPHRCREFRCDIPYIKFASPHVIPSSVTEIIKSVPPKKYMTKLMIKLQGYFDDSIKINCLVYGGYNNSLTSIVGFSYINKNHDCYRYWFNDEDE